MLKRPTPSALVDYQSRGLEGTSFKDERKAEDVTHLPEMVGEASRHGGASRTVATLETGDLEPKGLMRAGEVVEDAPPMDVQQSALLRFRQGPGLAAERGHPLPERQVEALDEGRLEGGGEALLEQGLKELSALAEQHAGDSEGSAIALLLVSAFDQLPISQLRIDDPSSSAPAADMFNYGSVSTTKA